MRVPHICKPVQYIHLNVLLFSKVNLIEVRSSETGPRFTKNLKSDRNRKPISGAKMRFTKNLNLIITTKFPNVNKL